MQNRYLEICEKKKRLVWRKFLIHCKQFMTPFLYTVNFICISPLFFFSKIDFCAKTQHNLDLNRSRGSGCSILLPVLLSFYHSGVGYWMFYCRNLSSA